MRRKKGRPTATRPTVETIALPIQDPTRHADIHAALRDHVQPRPTHLDGPLHINVSPRTPAMHAV